MILFLAGTSDSRAVAEMLKSAGIELELSVVSTYGQMLAEAKGLSCRAGALDEAGLVAWIKEHTCTAIVDGTHPYAIVATQTALKAAEQTDIPYLRLERKEEPLPQESWIYRVKTIEEAAKKAFELGTCIFLTTGSKTLGTFKNAQTEKSRLIARILPEPDGISQARELGFLPRDIIGMEGPFTKEMNEALFKNSLADVVVLKNSGKAGGTSEKLAACRALGIKAVILERSRLVLPNQYETGEELLEALQKLLK